MGMSKILEASRVKKPTPERVEDSEDLPDLEEAVRWNGDKPLIPVAKVKKYLDTD